MTVACHRPAEAHDHWERDFYLDLLFYHRSLHRLAAIELKLSDGAIPEMADRLALPFPW